MSEIILNSGQLVLLDELKKFAALQRFKGFYIYGEVGRGKTMLVTRFLSKSKIKNKIYIHFNSFMKRVHEELFQLRINRKTKTFLQTLFGARKDELFRAIDSIIGNANILCLDEFQVQDVADAMLLDRIFTYLFKKKLLIVFTSNYHPRELYKNGLKREVFLDFVDDTLLPNCRIFNLDGEQDYRTLKLANSLHQRYLVNSSKNQELIEKTIAEFTKNKLPQVVKLEVFGREVEVARSFGLTVIFDFKELCEVNLGAADYQAICRHFNFILLLNVPKLTSENRDTARRFTLFIDEVYENKTALVITAAAALNKIYEVGTQDAKRTSSRLMEIKSDEYFASSKFSAHA